MAEAMIKISLIDDPEWNSRLTETGEVDVSDLVASLPNGQINAITVEGPKEDGRYLLVTGWRRKRAAQELKWKEIRADVKPLSDSIARIIENVVENMQRKDLSLYEQARACAQLRAQGLKLTEVAEKTGLSKPFVSNLGVMYEKLPTLVKDAWKSQHEAATFNFLRQLATVEKDEAPEAAAERQIVEWQDRVAAYDDFAKATSEEPADDDGDEKPKKKNGKKSFKVTKETVDALAKAVQGSKLPGAGLAIHAIEVLIGKRDAIKGVWPPSGVWPPKGSKPVKEKG